MNVQPTTSYNIAMQGVRWDAIKRNLRKAIPKDTSIVLPKLDAEKLDKFVNIISEPAVNKIIVGGTALMTQPFIDYNNKAVDEETRRVSTCRTAAKIIAGTGVGLLIREGCAILVRCLTNVQKHGKIRHLLIPKSWFKKFIQNQKSLKNYRNCLSTFMAVAIMCHTNFSLDAPLTMKLTKVFTDFTERIRDKKANNKKGVGNE